MNRCCSNAVKESRSERVRLYRKEQGGFACLALPKIVYLFISVIKLIVGTTSIERGQIPATEKETQSMQCTIWCMLMTWQYEYVGLMPAKTERNEPIWIKDSNVSSFNIALLVHYLILLKQQGYFVLSCMKPLPMDRLNFSDQNSYINLFIWSYGVFSMNFWS